MNAPAPFISRLHDLPHGIPIHGSPFVPEDQMLVAAGHVYFHQRESIRARKRYPHGRSNGPRRWKVKVVTYRPAIDKILAAQDSTS